MAYVDASTTKFYFCELFLAVSFPARSKTKSENVQRNGCSYKKSKAGWLAAFLDQASCFCLVRAIKPNIDQLTWPMPTTRLGSLSAWRSCACTMGSFLESSGSQAQLCRKQHFGVLKKNAVNDWRAARCWLVLGGPGKACSRPHKTGQSPTRRFS